MIKFLSLAILCCLIQVSLAEVLERQLNIEALVFRPSPFDQDSDPEKISPLIQELHKIYSTNGGRGIYKDIVEKLAELSNLSDCDDEAFLKFDLLEDLRLNRNIRAYLRYQREAISKRCDKEIWPEFAKVVNNLDSYVSEYVSRLGQHVAAPYQADEITLRPLFFRNTLVVGIDGLFTEISKKYAKRELISNEELDTLYKTTVLGPCRGLTFEFDKIARFYVRNYLDKGTLKVCESAVKRWTYFSEVCSAVSDDSEKILKTLYKLALKKHSDPDKSLYKILEEIGA